MKALLLAASVGLLVPCGQHLCQGADGRAVTPRAGGTGTHAPATPRPEDPGGTASAGANPPRPKVKALRDLPYVEGGHERNRLDLYLPVKNESRLPVVVWIHGGAWNSGGKDACLNESVWLVFKGYAVVGINYRLSQHAPFPAQIEDCKAAIRWLRAHAAQYGLDPDRVGVWGVSAGGHLAALLGVTGDVPELEGAGGNPDQSSRVQCVVDWYGRTDLTMASSQNDADVTAAVSQLLGGPVDANRDQALRASPLRYASGNPAPFLIMHGDRDQRVPLKQSELLAGALKQAGGEVAFQVIQGAGHGGAEFKTPENWGRVERFFAKHLKPLRNAGTLSDPSGRE